MSVLTWSLIAFTCLTVAFGSDEMCARGFGMRWAFISYASLAGGAVATLMAVSVAL